MKKTTALFLALAVLATLTLLSGCGKEQSFKIPDVFGVNYSDATEVLEDEGFEVKAVETSVGAISQKLIFPLEKVEKGTVFKIDDYIKDGSGDLVKGSNDYYDGDMISRDKNIVIYYAKEDYISENEETESYSDSSATSFDEDTSSNKVESNTNNEDTADDGKLSDDFKNAMDSYEKFMNDYVEFMKKYKANPGDLSLISDYVDFMSKYADYVADFETWEDKDLNTAELAYYLDVQSRVSKKLLEVA